MGQACSHLPHMVHSQGNFDSISARSLPISTIRTILRGSNPLIPVIGHPAEHVPQAMQMSAGLSMGLSGAFCLIIDNCLLLVVSMFLYALLKSTARVRSPTLFLMNAPRSRAEEVSGYLYLFYKAASIASMTPLSSKSPRTVALLGQIAAHAPHPWQAS